MQRSNKNWDIGILGYWVGWYVFRPAFATLILCLVADCLTGQQLITFSGGFAEGSGGSLSWSVGEIGVQNRQDDEWLTEGFQQSELDETALADADIFIPEGITPGDDGKNDLWVIDSLINFPKNELVILNRWGEKVYEAKPYNNDWDGTRNGKKLPAGAYYYWLKLDPSHKAKKGPVYIVY